MLFFYTGPGSHKLYLEKKIIRALINKTVKILFLYNQIYRIRILRILLIADI